MASIVTAMATWGVMFYRSGYGLNTKYAFPEQGFPDWLLSVVPPFLPVVAITIAAAIALVVVSLATQPPSEKTLQKFFRR
jgi:hypothetical protein